MSIFSTLKYPINKSPTREEFDQLPEDIRCRFLGTQGYALIENDIDLVVWQLSAVYRTLSATHRHHSEGLHKNLQKIIYEYDE